MAVSDALVGVGAVLIGLGIYFLMGWPAVLVWCGVLVMVIGVAEAKRRTR